jgi:VIT1/CCC1 family predicted Fe2+/Mn2+ transporter
MVDRSAGRGHVVARVVVGVGYVVAGLLVLLAQIQDLTIAWSIVAPAAVVVLGVALLVTGVVDSRLHGQKPVKEVREVST